MALTMAAHIFHPQRHRPRQPLPPSKRVSYPNAMTIAAGFVASDGVLLCADTLYSDGYTKEYHDKVFTWTGNRLALVLAMWGHAANGRMAVDESIEAASKIKKGASISAIV